MKKAAIVLSAVALSACGGSSTPTPTQPTAVFNAGDAKSNVSATTSASSAASIAIIGAVSTLSLSSKSSITSVIDKKVAPQVNSTKNCASSGSVDVSLDDKDSSLSLSAGDIATITATVCKQYATGNLIEGKLVATLTTFTNTDDFSGSLVFTNFHAIDGDEDFTVNGSLSATIKNDSATKLYTEVATYDNLSFTNNSDKTTGKIISGSTKDQFSQDSSPSADEYLEYVDLLIDVHALSGIVKLTTNPRLAGKANLDYWSTGVLNLEGAGGATIELDASFGDITETRLTLISNGSTISQTVMWDDL